MVGLMGRERKKRKRREEDNNGYGIAQKVKDVENKNQKKMKK